MLRKAFTLIELLVVIAIISILAAILFPVLAQARESAKQAQCMIHMREIGLAMRMYTDDSDDMWVPASTYSPMPGYAPQQIWIGYDNNNLGYINGGFYGDVARPAIHPPRPGAIDLYLKNDDVKRCPKKPQAWQLALAYSWFNGSFYSAYYSTNPAAMGNEYGPGAKGVTAARGFYECQAANGSEMEKPSTTLILWEHSSRVPMCNFMQPDNWLNSPPNNPSLREHFHFLHREGANVVWGDTHSGRMIYDKLKRPMFSMNKGIYPGE